MNETVLILGKQSLIKQELVQGIAQSGRRIICAQDASEGEAEPHSESAYNATPGPTPPSEPNAPTRPVPRSALSNAQPPDPSAAPDNISLLPYTHGSFLSARTLFLDCSNKKLSIDHIFLLHSIREQSGTVHTLSGQEVEARIDTDIKGFVFLLRESIAHFQKAGRGVVNIVLQITGPEIQGPFEALVKGSIEGITTSLLTYYSREDYSFRGYRTAENDAKGYADYIVKSLNAGQAGGKWYSYRSRLLPFPRS